MRRFLILSFRRISKLTLAGFAAAAMASAPSVSAHETQAAPKFPYASLSAEAVTEVSRDTVRITLAAEVSAAAQADAASALTEKLDSVMKQVRDKDGVKAYSGNYRIWPMSDQDGRISDWRGRAEIILESADFEAVSKLAAAVGDRMPIANMSFFVAARERARHEAALLQEAAAVFRQRAQELAQAFGYASYSIREIQLGGSGASYRPESSRMMAMAADAAAGVPLEGGTERISLSVQGTIFLHSAKE